MGFNLSAWSLRHPSLVYYFMALVLIAGVFGYTHLGQSEDPPFTFKVMVVQSYWPGATAEQVSREVTERIEKKLMETGEYERVQSYSRPGESVIIFMARDDLRARQIPDLWYQVRKKVADIRHTLPADLQGPFFNDEFGTTFGNIYALTGEGFDYAVMKDYADRLQLQLQRLPAVGKVDLIGLQDEKIWIDLSNSRLATLGVPLSEVQAALNQQNVLSGSGFVETPDERVQLRVSGEFDSVEQIRDFPLNIRGQHFRLGDVAEVYRGFSDPAAPLMRFMGQPAIGLAVAMQDNGDILQLGKDLEAEFARLQKQLPAGMQLSKVSDQPAAVKDSVGEFLQVLAEALIVVMLVSFFSLGLRTGLVVSLSIPLVLAMTCALMDYFGIGLHKISLGALVLALGLLVDDAIIAVEMMAIKMEQGWDRFRAASFAWTSTAFPMLTGTFITAAGFLPIALAKSSTGEYTRSIFEVVTLALVTSWIAAVVFVPLLGAKLLPDLAQRHANKPQQGDPYATPMYQRIRRMVTLALQWRKTVLLVTVLLFAGSIFLFRFVPQQFFPVSSRLELMVDLKLEEGASLEATQRQAERLEAMLQGVEGIDNYVTYVGTGSPRFYLPLDQQLPATSFAQFVVLAKTLEDRERLRTWLIERMENDFPTVRGRVTRLESGPPVGYPVQFRVSGEDIPTVRAIARNVAAKVRENTLVTNVHLDWEEPSKVVWLTLDQERGRALGVSTEQIRNMVAQTMVGAAVGEFREDNELIQINLRGSPADRTQLALLPDLSIPTASGGRVPLNQIATLEYGFEEGIIWHRDRLPTVTVRADIYGAEQPATVTDQILPTLADIKAQLPDGYLLEVGGTVEDSARAQASVNAGMPLFVLVVITLLMVQLQSFSRSMLVFLTAPLGLIGVVLFLLLFGKPFGFVAMLGTIALSGMIMRNSVILVDQIEKDIQTGHDRYTAVIDATVRRFRPIVLTALAAVLAMIPLSRSDFFGPMAVAIMGGLVVATGLTLVFLPALYATCFRVRESEKVG